MALAILNKAGKSANRKGQKVQRKGLKLEKLEDRKLMAANLMADLQSNGVLRIEGTEGADTIVVRQVNNTLRIDGINIRANGSMNRSVNVNSVSRIDIHALGGNDRILLNSDAVAGQQAILKNTIIHGGSGDDTIVGGRGADRIWGGTNNDKIWGHHGDDQIYGDAGNDELYGGLGNDAIYGGDGHDKLWGEDGNDSLFGENGNDDLMGGNHNDNLYGGNDADRLWGQAGRDGLYGGAGNDLMWGGADSDRFLVMSGSNEHKDAASADAVLVFQNGNKNWNASEIQQLDGAFRQLHLKTGNDRLLETASRGTVTIIRDASNGTALGTNFNNGTIRMYDGAFSNAARAVQVMLHEIAHNFDTEGAGWNNWMKISSWRNVAPPASLKNQFEPGTDTKEKWWYDKHATFARTYGQTNPREDWATAWESYFKFKHNVATDMYVKSLPDAKTKHLDAFFAALT